MKNLMFKERLTRKLVNQYIGLYTIDKVISANAVKLQLPNSIRIHSVVNVSWVVQYKDQVGGQKKEEVKLVDVKGVKEWEVERILNKRKVRGVVKYLVQWKKFTAEYHSWEKEEDLENTKKVVAELKRRMNTEVKRQKKLGIVEKKDFRRRELLEKYTVKILYR